MQLKNVLASFFLMGVAYFSYSQSDARLEAMFSSETIQKIQQQSPEVLDFWTYVADNGVIEYSKTGNKETDTSGLEVVEYGENFNLLDNVGLVKGTRSYYATQDGQLLIVKSMPELTKEFNAQKEEKK